MWSKNIVSRKMVQMNLFAGQDRDADVRNKCVDMVGGEDELGGWD